MPADFTIIANPVSGSHASRAIAARVQACLEQRGAAVEVQFTTGPGDAQRLACQAAEAGVKVVVGCGGDGTLQEIASALEGTNSALGILPFGRCNDFARAFGIRRKDPVEKLADLLLAGRTQAVDLGAFGTRRFLTVATMGFDSEVSRFVETRNLWVRGTAAYLYGVLRVLTHFHFPKVRISGDFGTFEGRILLAATSNTPCYGGAMEIAPGAKLTDGQFHLCLIERVSRLEVLRMLPTVLKGKHISHPAVQMLTSRTLEIESATAQWICADGETLGQTPGRFEIHPAALRVVCSC
jgi:diacylglycerol kinase (ATP)